MTDAANLHAKASLCLSAPSPAAILAAPVLARHLGISRQAALRRMGAAPCILASDLDPQLAQRLLALMSAVGLRVRLVHSETTARRVDISVQLSVWSDADRLSHVLAVMTGLNPAELSASLALPGGLIQQDMQTEAANAFIAKLQRTRGLVVLQSDPETALYDVFTSTPMSDHDQTRLQSCLRVIGSTPDPVTGAVAAGLGRSLRDHVLSRLPDLGLFALDRCFQRYDLVLSDVSGWVTKDLADFLAGRTGQPRSRFEVISPETPVRIDLGLTPQVARQFRSDYAAIGLKTRLVLSGRSGNT